MRRFNGSLRARAIWGGGALVVVAGLLLTFRPGWSARTPATDDSPAGDRSREFQAAAMRADMKPQRTGVEAVVDGVLQEIEPQLAELELSAAAKEELRLTVRRRLHLVLEPDYDRWRQAAGDRVPPEADPTHPEHEKFMGKWETAAGQLRHSPVSSEGVVLRRVGSDWEPKLEAGTMFLRTGGPRTASVRYEEPPAGAEAVELLVPMRYKVAYDSKKILPVTASMRFYATTAKGPWQPSDMYLYFDEQAFGEKLSVPLY